MHTNHFRTMLLAGAVMVLVATAPFGSDLAHAQGFVRHVLMELDTGGGSTLYQVRDFGSTDQDGRSIGSVPSGIGTVYGLAGFDGTGWGSAEADDGEWYLITFPSFADPSSATRAPHPIGFPSVHGLAVTPNYHLFAVSYDSTTSRTSLITIDRNGQGALIGTTSTEVWLVGLGATYTSLYACSRPVDGAPTPRLYRLDPTTGAETELATLPEPLEGLGGFHGDLYLLGAGTNIYQIDPDTGMSLLIDVYWDDDPPSGQLVAVADPQGVSPTRSVSWSLLKDAFRTSDEGDRVRAR